MNLVWNIFNDLNYFLLLSTSVCTCNNLKQLINAEEQFSILRIVKLFYKSLPFFKLVIFKLLPIVLFYTKIS